MGVPRAPLRGSVQAAGSLWIQRHEVVETEVTHVEERVVVVKSEDEDSVMRKGGRFLRSSRGWIGKTLRLRRILGVRGT